MELTIQKLVYGGDGLARVYLGEGRSKAIFVPFVVPGERVEASVVDQRSGFDRARLERVLEASELRSDPPCPYFGECGGCQYQHIGYEAQLRFKADILRETLQRTAKLDLQTEMQLHSSPSLNYRNRTRLHVQAAPEPAVGYFRANSHELLPVRQCPISSKLINRAIARLWELGDASELPADLLQIELFANDDDTRLLAELYATQHSATHDRRLRFAQEFCSTLPVEGVVMFEMARARSTLGPELLLGRKSLTYAVGEHQYQVSAGAFFQTNRFLIPEMVNVVIRERKGRFALDLYCGVGLFTVPLSQRFERVTAVESNAVSVQDLRSNVADNVKVSAQSTEKYLASAGENLKPDLIVVDPPRTGLGTAVCQHLNRLGAQELIYISCDPATLARDLRQLISDSWRVVEIHLFDIFPQTFHIETCLVLQR